MTTSRKFVAAVVLSLAGVALPAAAHHSFAMFDQTKTLHADGAIVSQFRWTNPHSFVVVDVEDANGTTSYTLECNSINLMSRAGWKVNTLKPGDKVNVVYYPLRDGKPGGMLKTITLPDGRTLKAW
jgi:hypothetical protein